MECEETNGKNMNSVRWEMWATFIGIGLIAFNTVLAFHFMKPGEGSEFGLSTIVLSFISFHISAVLAIVMTLRWKVAPGKRLHEIYLDRGINLRIFFHALKLVVVLIPFTLVLNVCIQKTLGTLDYSVSSDPVITWLKTAPYSSWAVLVFGAVVIAPVAEEIMFRVVLNQP